MLRLLDVDAGLLRRVDPRQALSAADDLLVAVHYLRRGSWDPVSDIDDRRTPVGLLVLDGLLIRVVEIGKARDVELLGPGDVISPWRQEPGSVPASIAWRVPEGAGVAILDRTFEMACARYPGVLGELIGRAVERAQRQSVHRTLSHIGPLELRLLVLLWHLADRWGRVEREGVVLPLRLSQAALADLVGARRPSVSTALGRLERASRIRRWHEGGWLLLGLAPDLEAPAGFHLSGDLSAS